MEYERKIISVGSSIGIFLPSDLVKFLGFKAGDTIKIIDNPDGTIIIRKVN
jgi:antitoxin component of MazEF toxin-antitoxin module